MNVFSFNSDERFCNGFEEVLSQYREIVPNLRLAGPTSFAPVIDMATTIVEQSGGQYHVLLIIADGQVTRSVDTQNGQLSSQERKTVQAIVDARQVLVKCFMDWIGVCKFPLSIILVGVGDGPWDMMREFDDNIPARDFDNFQICAICLTNPKDMAFGCGHQVQLFASEVTISITPYSTFPPQLASSIILINDI
ncbi:E3 ubiquitin-protein ligase rglg2 [Phtheirospermum japonicum]|uniref:E3 ubiquitin-protein ligase rglg2 n=1 Tax=Phtheirospermum japonicum TaxID=374723 RepID=A0A830BBB9_9LAMI|nr:E3 ubiquitin-protein ligase rglg2 [Phtheirospermum japonicum]